MLSIRNAAICAVLWAVSAASVSAACVLQKIAEFPIVMHGNEPLVDVTINGRNVRMLIDTGSDVTLLTREAAHDLGLKLLPMNGVTFYGVGGGDKADFARLHEVRLGNVVAHDFGVVVTGNGLKSADFVGVLGRSFLMQSDIEFDLASGAIRMFKPKDCKGDDVAYWARGYAMAPIVRTPAGEAITVEAAVNGRKIIAEIDTGSTVSFVTSGAASIAGVTPTPAETAKGSLVGGLGADRVRTVVAVFSSLSVGDETIQNARMRVADLFAKDRGTELGSRISEEIGSLPEMLLGADWVRAHRVYVSKDQHRIYFTYNGGPIFEPPPEAASDKPAAKP